MTPTVLYFGSFNPIHNGHMAIARHMADNGYGEVWLVVSPQNPLKPAGSLAPDKDRLEMVEIAVKAEGNPNIKACGIEFDLPKPSYTIDTIRVLEERHPCRQFSLLIGGDILSELDSWKDYRTLLDNYRILVYPRGKEEGAGKYAGKVEMLNNVPLQPFSATEIRRRLENGEQCGTMLAPGVEAYIEGNGLYKNNNTETLRQVAALTDSITANSGDAAAHLERGKLYLHTGDFGQALNDFNRTLEIDPSNEEALQYADMVREILEFRYIDIYNP